MERADLFMYIRTSISILAFSIDNVRICDFVDLVTIMSCSSNCYVNLANHKGIEEAR